MDASGSVAGNELAAAVLTASALVQRMRPGDELGVIAFWSKAVVLRPLSADPRVDVVVDRLCDLRGGGTTDLELALQTAATASCAALAAAGGGRVAALHRPSQAPAAVRELLG